jgi:hypothetical protein
MFAVQVRALVTRGESEVFREIVTTSTSSEMSTGQSQLEPIINCAEL